MPTVKNTTKKAQRVGAVLLAPGESAACAPNVASGFIMKGCEIVSGAQAAPAKPITTPDPITPPTPKTKKKASSRY